MSIALDIIIPILIISAAFLYILSKKKSTVIIYEKTRKYLFI